MPEQRYNFPDYGGVGKPVVVISILIILVVLAGFGIDALIKKARVINNTVVTEGVITEMNCRVHGNYADESYSVRVNGKEYPITAYQYWEFQVNDSVRIYDKYGSDEFRLELIEAGDT